MNIKTTVTAIFFVLTLAAAGAAFQQNQSQPAAGAKSATQAQQTQKAKAANPEQKAKPKAAEPAGPEAEIKTVLDAQKAAWNAKKLDGFMDTYWKSKDLTFMAGTQVLHGWGAVQSHYQKNYPAAKMGTLDFSDLEIHLLGQNYAYVLGKWALNQGAEKKGGVFTLILHHTPKGWRIVHDHTV